MASSDEVFIHRAVRVGIIAGLVALVLLALLWLLKSALTPLAVAFVLAYLLDPLIDRFEARGVPRGLAIGTLLLAAGAVVLAFLGFVIPVMQRELSSLAERAPGYIDALATQVLPRLEETLRVKLPHTLEEGIERLRQGDGTLPIEPLRELLSRVLGLFTGTLGTLVGLVLIPVIAYYFLLEFDHIKLRILHYVPLGYQDYVQGKAEQVDRLIAGFIRGQLLVALCLGILYSAGFLVIGIDLALVIGFAAGLLGIIPYVGNVVALVSASVLCVLEFGFGVHLAAVVGWYAAVQTLEGYVLTPRIVGRSLGLHPVTVIVALLIGGDLLGFLGLLIAVPAAAVISVFVTEILETYRASALYTGPVEAELGSAPPGEERAKGP